MIAESECVMSAMMPVAVREKMGMFSATRGCMETDVANMLESGYVFGANGSCTIRVASSIEDRLKAWGLVYRMYAERGYAEPREDGLWYGPHDTLPEACTLLVERDGEPLATLTVTPDSPLGLAADQLYREEIDELRSRGRRPCEIISLASQEKNLRHGAEIVKHLFKLAYLAATRLMGATDFLITVNPRHVRFYERTLLLKRMGVEKEFTKVGGAPAVLLALDLTTAEQQYLEHYGDEEGSFYRFFVNQETEADLLEMMVRQHRILDADSLRRYFVERKPLLRALPSAYRQHLRAYYPNLV